MSQSFFGIVYLPLDVLDVKTTSILELDSFEQIPDPFLRIEFRGVDRQAFEMNAFGSAFGQKVFDHLRARSNDATAQCEYRK